MPNFNPAVAPVPSPHPKPVAQPAQQKAEAAKTAVQTVTPEPAKTPADALKVSTPNLQGSAAASISLDAEPKSEPQFILHTVRRGENLSKIAKQHLGSLNKHDEIYQANRDSMRNPDDLRIGMVLRIPVPAGTKPVEQPAVKPEPVEPVVTDKPATEQATYKVRRGDNLSSIALETLGDSERYMELYRANRDQLKNPDDLRLGMVLRIPGKTQPVKPDTPQPVKPVPVNPAPVTPTQPVDAAGLTPRAKELFQSMVDYQKHHAELGNKSRTKTSEAQLLEIARELDSASTAFNVDPKMMLALFAHESAGINPGARSHTGAGGLGQLTSVAIRQVHFMAGIAKGRKGEAPFNQYKSNFVQSTRSIKERYDIKANVWTSVAYMSYELNDRASLGRGVEKALKRYGDPNVSTYANKVNAEYKTLFGGKLF